ncbi:thiamine-monophosphate kinase [Salinarchaeum sp. Harcht-Bsk1]|uniref:thiamine-phosphate kinase n=1 Tax=Salinarchaeum sp. Harcht-Bsk1 TaxID=1333523 RepID=UPI000342460A|nr:thiamine-phosphate kinase [Salinarchaeum sp. Harcht-Bsk1]AGN00568.1 thiamine-monophosphate kinase [Salinarchaeum sp. Harcht-Bsk1]
MDERAALRMLDTALPSAGDDAAVVDGQVVTTDMLHDATDFPDGTTRYTAGWRSVGASLSDVAAMGAEATSAVAVYAAPEFDESELLDFVAGASDVCESVDAAYVGGDLDQHVEFTVATTALGETEDPVLRSGAEPGDAVCVTGALGRSGAGFRYFQRWQDDGDEAALERANDLFQFPPRVAAGGALAEYASSMMDSSDGLARSLHQIAEASDCGVAIDSDRLPVHDGIEAVAMDAEDRLELTTFFGEDFELVLTVPAADLDAAQAACPIPLTKVGDVTEPGPADATEQPALTMDGAALPDRGYTHGGD